MFCEYQISIFIRTVLNAQVRNLRLIKQFIECNKSLEHGGFFVKDGGFYCQDDYRRYFIAKCKICSEDLTGEVVTALNFSFHRGCFKCNKCSITFRPGDRVTVWQEKFYCPHCINQVCCSATVGSVPSKNLLQTPLSVTDDEGCVSASDMASSQYIHEQLIEMNQPQNDFSCISSAGLPQKSRSILRKPIIEQNGLHASKERGYLSKSLHYRVLILIRRHRFWSRRAFMRSKP
ncbi:unnamed protein product [Schistosoma mattheei]|uniref:Uncharacterized protein n=1 Tax=Schistosoma mattheei TaxID=31246 RepID=A0A183PAZ8_9TREM|nr:unnamed protein product [Schistosoma mattheei]